MQETAFLVFNDQDFSAFRSLDLFGSAKVIFWSGLSADVRSVVSGNPGAITVLPDVVDRYREMLHDEYLDWIRKCSSHSFKGKSNVCQMRLPGKASTWWSSLVFEKSNISKSSYISDVIKLIALHYVAPSLRIKRLVLSRDCGEHILQCISDVARAHDWQISLLGGTCLRPRDNNSVTKVNHLFEKASGYLRGCSLLLKAYIQALSCRLSAGFDLCLLSRFRGTLTFITYSASMSKSTISAGCLNQNIYWHRLPERLRSKGIQSNWLYIFAKDPQFASLKDAFHFIEELNSASSLAGQHHFLLDVLFDSHDLVSGVINLSRLFWKSIHVGPDEALPPYKGIRINLFHGSSLFDSLGGISSARNIYFLLLFEKFFSSVAPQRDLVYLQENMDWEYLAI